MQTLLFFALTIFFLCGSVTPKPHFKIKDKKKDDDQYHFDPYPKWDGES